MDFFRNVPFYVFACSSEQTLSISNIRECFGIYGSRAIFFILCPKFICLVKRRRKLSPKLGRAVFFPINCQKPPNSQIFIWKWKKLHKRRIVPWQKLGKGKEGLQPPEMTSKPSTGLQKVGRQTTANYQLQSSCGIKKTAPISLKFFMAEREIPEVNIIPSTPAVGQFIKSEIINRFYFLTKPSLNSMAKSTSDLVGRKPLSGRGPGD